jgi:hypothetical protein
MNAKNESHNTAFLRGGDGVDYCGAATLSSGFNRWNSLVVNEAAVISAATFKDKEGAAVSFTPTWLNVTLSAGAFIPFGLVNEAEIFCTSITVTSGSVLLYKD